MKSGLDKTSESESAPLLPPTVQRSNTNRTRPSWLQILDLRRFLTNVDVSAWFKARTMEMAITSAGDGGDVVLGMVSTEDELGNEGVDSALISEEPTSGQPEEEQLTMSAKFLQKTAKLIVPWFYLTIVGVLAIWITGFAAKVDDMFWGILILNVVTACIGAWSVYMYGCVSEQIDKFKEENDGYERNLGQLSQFREELTQDVDGLMRQSESMSEASATLKTQVMAFDPLLDELKKICGDNEDIAKMLDSTNSIFNDMQKAIVQDERAELLRVYYDVCFRDESEGLSKGEYRRLLAKMSDKYRAMFESRGSFDQIAGADGKIDLQEYTDVLEFVLKEVETKLAIDFGD